MDNDNNRISAWNFEGPERLITYEDKPIEIKLNEEQAKGAAKLLTILLEYNVSYKLKKINNE